MLASSSPFLSSDALCLFKFLFLFLREDSLFQGFECFRIGEFFRYVSVDVHFCQQFFPHRYVVTDGGDTFAHSLNKTGSFCGFNQVFETLGRRGSDF
jgi:hypothetical protein